MTTLEINGITKGQQSVFNDWYGKERIKEAYLSKANLLVIIQESKNQKYFTMYFIGVRGGFKGKRVYKNYSSDYGCTNLIYKEY